MSASDDSNAVFGEEVEWKAGMGSDRPLGGALGGIDKVLEVILEHKLKDMTSQMRKLKEQLNNGG